MSSHRKALAGLAVLRRQSSLAICYGRSQPSRRAVVAPPRQFSLCVPQRAETSLPSARLPFAEPPSEESLTELRALQTTTCADCLQALGYARLDEPPLFRDALPTAIASHLASLATTQHDDTNWLTALLETSDLDSCSDALDPTCLARIPSVLVNVLAHKCRTTRDGDLLYDTLRNALASAAVDDDRALAWLKATVAALGRQRRDNLTFRIIAWLCQSNDARTTRLRARRSTWTALASALSSVAVVACPANAPAYSLLCATAAKSLTEDQSRLRTFSVLLYRSDLLEYEDAARLVELLDSHRLRLNMGICLAMAWAANAAPDHDGARTQHWLEEASRHHTVVKDAIWSGPRPVAGPRRGRRIRLWRWCLQDVTFASLAYRLQHMSGQDALDQYNAAREDSRAKRALSDAARPQRAQPSANFTRLSLVCVVLSRAASDPQVPVGTVLAFLSDVRDQRRLGQIRHRLVSVETAKGLQTQVLSPYVYEVLLEGFLYRNDPAQILNAWHELLLPDLTVDINSQHVRMYATALIRLGRTALALKIICYFAQSVSVTDGDGDIEFLRFIHHPRIEKAHQHSHFSSRELLKLTRELTYAQRFDEVYELWQVHAGEEGERSASSYAVLLEAARKAVLSRRLVEWQGRQPWQYAMELYWHVLVNAYPAVARQMDKYRDVSSLLRALPTLAEPEGRSISLESVSEAQADLISEEAFGELIRLYAYTESAAEIPLILAWMRQLGVKPSRPSLVIAISAFARSVRTPALISALSSWLQDWLGRAAMPTFAETEESLSMLRDGELSKYLNRKSIAVAREYFPEMQLETVTGAGHWVHSEKPSEFMQLMREFCA
ncbi:uncharacterized protein L969DRAFT_23563 [Mixia osmundae IAM 14324]|uniref:AB hydrolase-1 domain-containing protein n=1 Tax=Mixia osmundae (strain CBS 9802 / IAM 14324 / JCM 22182 / KY 12970) TaxID=764103 RepID=G7EA17_MIXOS|nr:uncharacterized protein L969DRAFT_23563 [Mixia osmundae IAM 14324]KEI40364.1 hypothetical protein L969DRAFT_23563 [Mixia osmundae IAM 14324]GAA99677.1 hypothetical protein E5Q_06380 [Mixia osmundae IAM 14324]